MKFVIASSLRTGSHALASALDQHSQIDCAGECHYRPHEFGVEGETPSKAVKSAYAKYDGFIRHRSGEVHCPDRCHNSLLWEAIFSAQPKIINLKRADTLAQTISLFSAMQTGTWQRSKRKSKVLKGYVETSTKAKPFRLSIEDCRRTIQQFQSEYQDHDKLIAKSGLESIEIFYEDLLDDWDNQLAKIQEFLGVPVEALEAATIKQGGGDRSLVTNYPALRQEFAQGPWAPLFYPTTPSKVKGDNRIINGLWIGQLGIMERLTIRSFIDHGHEFHLWSYDPVENAEGAIVRDANESVPRDQVFCYDPGSMVEKSVAGFSDIFRFALLHQLGGWWVDMDVTCLRPFDFREKYVLRSTTWLRNTTGNILKLPQGSEFAEAVLRTTRELVGRDNIQFLLPEAIISVEIAKSKMQKYLVSPEHFLNIQIHQQPPNGKYLPNFKTPQERRTAYNDDNQWKLYLTGSAYGVHWCNHSGQWKGLDKANPIKGTLYEKLLARHGLVEIFKAEPKQWSAFGPLNQMNTAKPE